MHRFLALLLKSGLIVITLILCPMVGGLVISKIFPVSFDLAFLLVFAGVLILVPAIWRDADAALGYKVSEEYAAVVAARSRYLRAGIILLAALALFIWSYVHYT